MLSGDGPGSMDSVLILKHEKIWKDKVSLLLFKAWWTHEYKVENAVCHSCFPTLPGDRGSPVFGVSGAAEARSNATTLAPARAILRLLETVSCTTSLVSPLPCPQATACPVVVSHNLMLLAVLSACYWRCVPDSTRWLACRCIRLERLRQDAWYYM